MGRLINRGLSLVIYLSYLAVAYFRGAGLITMKLAVFLLLPMGCIWFAEALGGYTGLDGHLQVIDTPTPPFLICAGGWILLVGVPVVLYFVLRGAS